MRRARRSLVVHESAGAGIAERAGRAQGIGLNEHVRQARYGELDQCRVGTGWHLDLQRDFCAAEVGQPIGARSIVPSGRLVIRTPSRTPLASGVAK